jgi:hypothetical protein
MTDKPADPNITGCIIASTTVIPEIARMRAHVDDVLREHRHHDGRLDRLHLQAEEASRRLTRLEGLVETQSKESHELTRRFDSLDNKVAALIDGFSHVRNDVASLLQAFTDHGIKTNEQHNRRMRGQMSLWALLGGSLVILSAMHYQATGITPLESIAAWAGRMMP